MSPLDAPIAPAAPNAVPKAYRVLARVLVGAVLRDLGIVGAPENDNVAQHETTRCYDAPHGKDTGRASPG